MLIKRSNTTIVTIMPSTQSRYERAIMADHRVTLQWTQAVCTTLYVGDYVDYGGIRFTLNRLPQIKKKAANLFEYNAVFEAPQHDMAKVAFMLFDNTATIPQGEFSLTGNGLTFVQLLVANMNRIYGAGVWSVGDVDTTVYTTLQFSNETCAAVLARLATEFNTEWDVDSRTVHLTKRERTSTLVLEYGSTLYDIERTETNSAGIVTRLYAFGSTRNIAASYRGGSKRLMLPSPALHIEANTNLYGVIEAAKQFDDIYPRLSSGGAGTVTAVNTGDRRKFTDSALDFDVNSYLIEGTTAKIHFNTGQLAGYDYEISSYVHSTRTFTIIPVTDEKDYTLPNTTIYPAVGDKYVLIDISMPEAYVSAAETELYNAALAYLQKNSSPQVTYRCTFSDLYAKVNAPDLQAGDKVTLTDTQLGIDEEIRVVKISRGITDDWRIDIDLSNTITVGALARIVADIKNNDITQVTAGNTIKRNYVQAYKNLAELRAAVFDTDGYFDPANIKPLSIETSMLSVGSKSQQFQTDIIITPNLNGNFNEVGWTAGNLIHFTISESEVRTWPISGGNTDGVEDDLNPYYIYVLASRASSAAAIEITQTKYRFDEDPDYYRFLMGVLHTPVEGVRAMSFTYGQTVINGQFIRTGVISSIDGASYFNLNTGDIVAGNNSLFGDGSASLAGGNILWDILGNIILNNITAQSGRIGQLTIQGNSLIADSIKLSDSAVETLSSLNSPTTVDISRQSSWTGSDTTEAISETQNIVVTDDAKIKFKASANSDRPSLNKRYQVRVLNGEAPVFNTGIKTGFINDKLFVVNVIPGTYTVEVTSFSDDQVAGAYTTGLKGDTTNDTITAYMAVAQTKIGNNGFYSYWDTDKYVYFSSAYGWEFRWGNYGMRGTSAGLQKMTSGTWTTL